MAKTASKRAQSRKVAQVRRAHETPLQPKVRKVPLAQRRAKPKGVAAFIQNYPMATTIFVVLLLVMGLFTLKSAKLGPFAPPPPPKPLVLSCTQPKTRTWQSAPEMKIDQNKQYTATVHTTKGDIEIALDAKNSPIAVNNFVFLAQNNYYCGTYFWRVEKPGQASPLDGQPSQLSLIQGGSVAKNGQDAPGKYPGYGIKDEPVVGDYTEGSVAMAKSSDPNSAGAQFFVDTADESQFFQKTYQIIGHVTAGLDVAKKITAGDVMEGVTIKEK